MTPIIEDMFSHELHENFWRKYTTEKVIDLLKEKMKEKDIKLTDKHYLLLKELKVCKNMEECLQVLTNNMLGQIDE